MNEYSDPGAGDEGRTVELRPDLDAVTDFLQRYRSEGPWVLTAIPAKGQTKTATFRTASAAEMCGWVERLNSAEYHIYFMANPPMRDLDSKARKEDVRDMAVLHVDIDPGKGEDPAAARAAAIARLEAYVPPPSIVIDSGGGVQALWLLDEGLPIDGNPTGAEEAERYNQQLEAELGGDHCHNLDRILRLPGTINWKRKDGRVPRLARLEQFHEDRVYSLADFTPAPARSAAPAAGQARVQLERGELVRLGSEEELERWEVPGWATATIVQGTNPLEPDKWSGDRSRAVHAVACELVRRGVPPPLIVGILTDEGLGIASHVLAQKRAIEYAWRQVERATAAVATQADDFARDKDGKAYANHQGNVRLAVRKLGVELPAYDIDFVERPK